MVEKLSFEEWSKLAKEYFKKFGEKESNKLINYEKN